MASQRLRELASAGPRTLVILDEASMVDLASMHGLLRRLPDGARLLLIGDERQLPPVGFGLLFHRLIEEPSITAGLSAIHRQQNPTGIPAAPAFLRRCKMPPLVSVESCRTGLFYDLGAIPLTRSKKREK
jgi:exodeoxyribonuclease V alpha subunit